VSYAADLIVALAAAGIHDPELAFDRGLALLPAIDRLGYVERLTSDEPMDGWEGGCKTFVLPILKVTRVFPGEQRESAKCRVWYAEGEHETPQGFKDPGYIETGWLGRDLPDRIARIAQSCARTGTKARFYKRNRTDDTGSVTAGYRELVWLQPVGQPEMSEVVDEREEDRRAQEDMRSGHADVHAEAVYDLTDDGPF